MAIQNISVADKPTLDAVNAKMDAAVSSRMAVDTALTMTLAGRATEESLTWALKQNGIGKALDSMAGLGNATLSGCATFAAILANGTARTAILNSPVILGTILLTKYGANAIVNNSSCMSVIGASAALRAEVLQYDYFNREALDSASVMAVIDASSGWIEDIIDNPSVFAYFIENSHFAGVVTASAAYFTEIAASSNLIHAVYFSNTGRTAMYNNRALTESIIQASSTALEAINSLSVSMNAPASGTNVVVFNYPVWIVSKYITNSSQCTANTTTFADGTTNTSNTQNTTILNKFANNQICTTSNAASFRVSIFAI